ncbi:hypothetical protein [Candidatus Methylomirabilis sp.]|uniref:esterase/lipase family protein n=1 Tax=Candidatus Methylomirabilis sp. TaxID=2032687 RepID=UPI002A5CBF4A|nr:hypothetical protein [Candidatus Methylomirabilis sp.]
MPGVTLPFLPIIYVRGYAMWMKDIIETTSTPYMGFNDGATKIRRGPDREVQKLFFESPLVRLMKDYGYTDMYRDGHELPDALSPRCVVICRYYDPADPDFGGQPRPTIEAGASCLAALILRVRELTCDTRDERERFRVYLVAHSMGGLICRKLLQNPAGSDEETAKSLVRRVFTYATPHGGIESRDFPLFGSLGAHLTRFSPLNIAKTMGLRNRNGPVNTLNKKWIPEEFFCLVGTNYKDYPSRVRLIIGDGSDGLVRVKNAWMPECPHAMVHRSHSGPHGIVNSEEGYRHLVRFLFGSATVKGLLSIRNLPSGNRGGATFVDLLGGPAGDRGRSGLPSGNRGGATFDVEVTVTENDGVAISERTARLWSELPADADPRNGATTANKPFMKVPIFSLYLPNPPIVSEPSRSALVPSLCFTVEIAVVVRGRVLQGKMHAPDVFREPVYRGSFMVHVWQDDNRELGARLMGLDGKWASNFRREAQTVGREFGAPGLKSDVPLNSEKGFSGTLHLRITPRDDDIAPSPPAPAVGGGTSGMDIESGLATGALDTGMLNDQQITESEGTES